MPRPDDKEIEIIPSELEIQIAKPFQSMGGGEANAEDFTLEELQIARSVRLFRKGIKTESGKGLYCAPRETAKAVRLTEFLRLFVEEDDDHGVLGLPKSDTLIVRAQGDQADGDGDDLMQLDGPAETGEDGIGKLDMKVSLLKLPKFAKASIEGVIDEAGLIYYNTTDDDIRWYNGTSWATL